MPEVMASTVRPVPRPACVSGRPRPDGTESGMVHAAHGPANCRGGAERARAHRVQLGLAADGVPQDPIVFFFNLFSVQRSRQYDFDEIARLTSGVIAG